jgi:hypothetical protein
MFATASNASAWPASEGVLDIAQDGVVYGKLNGSPARLMMRGNGIAYPVLNPDVAEALKLRTNIFANLLGIQAKVGPNTIQGHTGKIKLMLDNRESTPRALWFDKLVAPGLDGSLGPYAVSQSRIRLNIGTRVEHAKLVSLPLQIEDGRVGINIGVGENTVFVMFDPAREHSVASAGAGQLIARAYDGKWSGKESLELIDFGIQRPVRELALANPMQIGNLNISKLFIRDYVRVTGVDEMNMPPDDMDSNEVVLPAVTVTAKVRIKPTYKLTLGRDVLKQCASILFDKTSNQIGLLCNSMEL